MNGGGCLVAANQTALGDTQTAECGQAMEKLAPACHQLMEEHRIDFNVKAGETILRDRWVFHRTKAVLNATENFVRE
eukprot:scaffold44974_cov176-Amphora_coffeaeformis.AAC.5